MFRVLLQKRWISRDERINFFRHQFSSLSTRPDVRVQATRCVHQLRVCDEVAQFHNLLFRKILREGLDLHVRGDFHRSDALLLHPRVNNVRLHLSELQFCHLRHQLGVVGDNPVDSLGHQCGNFRARSDRRV